MAIDTRSRRSSVQAYAMCYTMPPPDGTIGAVDRAHKAGFYSGLTYGTPATPLIRTGGWHWPLGLFDTIPHN